MSGNGVKGEHEQIIRWKVTGEICQKNFRVEIRENLHV
jgi:hypothetical protein